MRIVIPGGTGQLGQILARHFHATGHEVTVLSRTPKPTPWATIEWDGLTLSPTWSRTLEGADAVIHLSGRSVNCRYTAANRRAILDSRVIPTRLLGRAIEQSTNPPKLWFNSSGSTVYAQSYDTPQDEFTGTLDPEPTREFSANVVLAWEAAFAESTTPSTRKIALRTSMVASPDRGGVLSVLLNLVRFGLGGTQGPGNQIVSWIHSEDYIRAVEFLIAHPEISGPVNMTSPAPLPNRDFMRDLRRAWDTPIGFPAYKWQLEIGAVFLRTETELILRSRKVAPGVLLQNGFVFSHPEWQEAAKDLVMKFKAS